MTRTTTHGLQAACLTLGLLTAGCTTTAEPATPQRPSRVHIEQLGRAPTPPSDCHLTVGFGSFAMGPPDSAPVTDLLTRSPRVSRLVGWVWGREGESSLCVYARSPSDVEPLYRQLLPLARAARGGYIGLSVRGVSRYQTPWRDPAQPAPRPAATR